MNDPSESARPDERRQEPESGAPSPDADRFADPTSNTGHDDADRREAGTPQAGSGPDLTKAPTPAQTPPPQIGAPEGWAPQTWAPPPAGEPQYAPPGTAGNQPPSGQPQYRYPGPPQNQWRPDAAIRPGVIPLRPLGLGEILDGAISFIRSNPLVTIGLSAAVAAVAQLLQLLLGLVMGSGRLPNAEDALSNPEAYLRDFSDYIGSALVAGVVSFVAVSMLTGLLIVVLSQAVLGLRMAIGEAWRTSRRRLPGLVGITFLAGIGVSLPIVVLLLPALLATAVGAGSGIVVVLAVLGFLGGVAAAVYLWVSWSLIAPVYVLEHSGVIAAFRRSRALVAPQWWRILGILLLAAIIATIIGGIIGVPFSFAAIALSESPNVLSVGAQVLIGIGTVLAGMLTTPFQAGVTGLIYFDQRIRREGLDITLQRAAGR